MDLSRSIWFVRQGENIVQEGEQGDVIEQSCQEYKVYNTHVVRYFRGITTGENGDDNQKEIENCADPSPHYRNRIPCLILVSYSLSPLQHSSSPFVSEVFIPIVGVCHLNNLN